MRPWRRIQHAFSIPRQSFRPAQDEPLVQWSQWDEIGKTRNNTGSLVRVRCAYCQVMFENVDRAAICPMCRLPFELSLSFGRPRLKMYRIAILGMGALGVFAVVVALMRAGGFGSVFGVFDLLLLPVCFGIGCVVGLGSAPVVSVTLERADFRCAPPLVYGGSAIVVALYLTNTYSFCFPIDSALPALLSVCGLSVVASYTCPSIRAPHPDHCAKCDYDLFGSSGTVCPECGTAISPMSQHVSNPRAQIDATAQT